MPFPNDKKTFLEKPDQSKKGSPDEKIIPLVELINRKEEYYTTSSCSGRVYLWKGGGRKNEMERLKVSHDLIDEKFFEIEEGQGFKIDEKLVWLRLEPMILHVACQDMESANLLLEKARKLCKKSSLLSLQNKIIIEIRSSQFIEMPLWKDGECLFPDKGLLKELVNGKLKEVWEKVGKMGEVMAEDS